MEKTAESITGESSELFAFLLPIMSNESDVWLQLQVLLDSSSARSFRATVELSKVRRCRVRYSHSTACNRSARKFVFHLKYSAGYTLMVHRYDVHH